MSIEFFEGFEGGSPGDWQGIGGLDFRAADARSGGFGLGTNSVSAANALQLLPATAKKTVGFAFRTNGTIFGASSIQVISLMSDTGVTYHLTLTFDGTGHLQLRLGSNTGAIIATSTQVFTANVWHYIEIQATIADSGGRCTIRVDGVTWVDFTGDTRNAGTSTNIDAIRFATGGFAGVSAGSTSWDDFYVLNGTDDTATTGRTDNDFLGDIKVESLLPNGDGAASAWTPSTGTTHSTLVDEPSPPNTTDYVSATTNGLQDLWTLADLSITTGTVFAVRPTLYAAKTDAGAASIKPVIRESGGTVTVDSTATPLSVTYAPYWGTLRKTKPGGGAWTISDVNGLQLGVEKA